MSDTTVEVDRRNDAELIAAARSGDDDGAYAELFRRHAGAARAAARALAGKRTEVDDLVSEGFARVLNAIRRGGGPELAFRPYLLTCIRNVFYDRARADARVEPTDGMPDVVDAALEARAASGDDRALVAQAYASLPERWQLVLWHTEIEGLPAAEVAPLIGLVPNAVAALSYRAREGLREAYLQAHLHRTPPASCGEARLRLGGYARESLSGRDRQMVEKHLERCERCRAILVELRDVAASLRAVVAPALLGAPLAGYLAKLGSGKAGAMIARHWNGRSRTSKVTAAVAAVAVVALAAVGAAAMTASVRRPQIAGGASTTVTPSADAPARSGTPTTRAKPTTSARPSISASPSVSVSTATPTTGTTATTVSTGSTVPVSPTTKASRPTVLGNTAAPTTVARTTTTADRVGIGPTPGHRGATTTVAPHVADLSVSLAPLGPAVPGHDVYLSAVVTNDGPDAASGVVVSVDTSPLPSLAFEDASPATWACRASSAMVRCTIAELAYPASSTIVLHLSPKIGGAQRFRSAQAVATVTASVSSSAIDRGPSTNSSSVDLPLVDANTPSLAPLFATVDHGDVLITGNTLMQCDTAPRCGGSTNDGLAMTAVAAGTGVEGATATSSATLTVPAGADVTHAWLMWGAREASDSAGDYASAYLAGPNGVKKVGAVPVSSVGAGRYARVDVTDTVRAGGSGVYTFSSLGGYTSTGSNLAGGWSLVVVTRQASEPQRVLIVLDGLVTYSAGADLALPLGGLGAAGGGSRAAHVGAVAWDGDRGSATDSMVLVVGGARRPICDSLHPADDVMDSVVSVGGAFGDPTTTNTLGFDAWLVDVDLDTTTCPAVGGLGLAIVAAPAGSLSLDLSASEQIWLGAITLAVPT